MIATMFGFNTPDYFQAEQGSTHVPIVQF